mmetsp:Transcript_18327/g.20372  ORF Transcript_18327/g.20372 Transcript_18327/m.20372 type:complete len:181 (+) Transcript_18327:104-646(+)
MSGDAKRVQSGIERTEIGILHLPKELHRELMALDHTIYINLPLLSKTFSRLRFDDKLNKTGRWKRFANGRLSQQGDFVAGVAEGTRYHWDSNGRLLTCGFYKCGKLQGVYKRWWRNGERRMECTFQAGVVNGMFLRWYSNGQMREACMISSGYTEGSYKRWRSSGTMVEQREYIRGLVIK